MPREKTIVQSATDEAVSKLMNSVEIVKGDGRALNRLLLTEDGPIDELSCVYVHDKLRFEVLRKNNSLIPYLETRNGVKIVTGFEEDTDGPPISEKVVSVLNKHILNPFCGLYVGYLISNGVFGLTVLGTQDDFGGGYCKLYYRVDL